MSSAAMPAAMGVAVDVPSLRIICFEPSYPDSLDKLTGQAAKTPHQARYIFPHL